MSGQWEVVGKKKDRSGKSQQNGNFQKIVTKPVKVEEVLTATQLKSLYSTGKNKENKKPQEKVGPVRNDEPKKAPKKKADKPQESKPKSYKNIESALAAINVKDFNETFEKNKVLFSSTPIVWLKELSQFLNAKINVDNQDPVFSGKPEGYPLSIVPQGFKVVIEKAVKEAGTGNVAVFFDICLTSMANDLNKDLLALGYKIFLQYLGVNNPNFVLNSMDKYINLRNSYQNRQNVGLSILWALAQGGLQNINTGLKVFREIMLPLLEMKNYTQFILGYLTKLLNKHEANISSDEFFTITDVIFVPKKNVSKDLIKGLVTLVPKLKNGLIKNASGKFLFNIEVFLKKLEQSDNSKYCDTLCEIILSSMQKDHNTYKSFLKVYSKYLFGCSILLDYIDKNWTSVQNLINVKNFNSVLLSISIENEVLMEKKRKDKGLLECVSTIKNMSKKMAKKSKSSGIIYRTLKTFLLLAIAAFILIDINQAGWKESKISTALNKTGVYKYTNIALDKCIVGSEWVHGRIEEKFPGFTERTIELTSPYYELGRDLTIISRNMVHKASQGVQEKIPVLIETIDLYAPGLRDNVRFGFNKSVEVLLNFYVKSKDYLLNEVFVNNLAPEEIQKKIIESTSLLAKKIQESGLWIYQKIESTIK